MAGYYTCDKFARVMADGDARDAADRELRKQLEAAEATAHIGSWHWTIATGAVTWSDELYRLYGLEPGSVPITLEFFLSRTHPGEREHIEREIRAVLQHPGPFAYREVIVRPDGSSRTLDTVGHAIVDEHGAIERVVGTCRDITDVVSRDERLRFYAQVFEHAEIGLTAWQLDRRCEPVELRLVAFNAATERLVGAPLGHQLGQPLTSIVPGLAGTALLDTARKLAHDGEVHRAAPFRLRQAQGAPILSVTVFAVPGQHVGLAFEDVTDQVHSQVIQSGERRALELLAAGAPLSEVLEVIVRAIEDVSIGTIASILLLDETGTKVRHGAAPGLPPAYNLAIDGEAIGPRAGSCGTAMFRREPVITTDIDRDPLWEPYRQLARDFGLGSCWSFPILSDDGRIFGTFALYHREPRAPDDAARELMKRAAHVAGIVIERRNLQDQHRALAARIEAAREDERSSIARDIHDQLGQSLTALKLDLGWLRRRIQDGELQRKLDDMASATDEILASIRRISADLRPGILDDLGLGAAIEWQAEEFQRRSGTPCNVRSNLSDLRLDPDLATNVFRIFQEALTNVVRHAEAKQVDVAIGLDHGRLRLEVADDGIGVPEIGPRGATLGLLGMRERARRLGGDCTIKRRSPRGTVVSVDVPLRFPAERISGAIR
jgi:PAS domain S-box-containing protein